MDRVHLSSHLHQHCSYLFSLWSYPDCSEKELKVLTCIFLMAEGAECLKESLLGFSLSWTLSPFFIFPFGLLVSLFSFLSYFYILNINSGFSFPSFGNTVSHRLLCDGAFSPLSLHRSDSCCCPGLWVCGHHFIGGVSDLANKIPSGLQL